jgi:hypothetical protein
VSGSADALPGIQQWWPYLTMGARHRLLAQPREPLGTRVRDEIRRAIGAPLPEPAFLSEEDRSFLTSQHGEVEQR